MHTFSLIITLLFTSVFAAPHPQYGLPLAHISTSAASTAIPTSTASLPSPSSTKPPILTILPSTSTSSPAPTSTPDREVASVFICEHVNWGGACEHLFHPTGTSESDCTVLDGKASSIGPDEGWTCLFYTNAFCRALASDKSDFLEIEYPGIANLGKTEKGDFNDKARSYLCVKKE